MILLGERKACASDETLDSRGGGWRYSVVSSPSLQVPKKSADYAAMSVSMVAKTLGSAGEDKPWVVNLQSDDDGGIVAREDFRSFVAARISAPPAVCRPEFILLEAFRSRFTAGNSLKLAEMLLRSRGVFNIAAELPSGRTVLHELAIDNDGDAIALIASIYSEAEAGRRPDAGAPSTDDDGGKAPSASSAPRRREDFSSAAKYGQYVKATLEPGMRVRAIESFDSGHVAVDGLPRIRAGDTGTFRRGNCGSPPCNCSWDKDGTAYWVPWHAVEIEASRCVAWPVLIARVALLRWVCVRDVEFSYVMFSLLGVFPLQLINIRSFSGAAQRRWSRFRCGSAVGHQSR